jgi:hypothetical protein
MSNQNDDVWPVLEPVKLPESAKYDYGVWFALSDITGSTDPTHNNDEISTASKMKSWLKKNIPNATYGSSGDLLIVPICMSKDEYESHFATDEETGEYLTSVTEPCGGRLVWLKHQYDDQQPKARKIREVSGQGFAAGAIPGSNFGGGMF